MNKKSVIMVVAKYPATHGHTTVINQLCKNLNQLGFRAAIGAFKFDEDPPFKIPKVKLSKSKLLLHGVNSLDFDIIHSHQSQVNYYLLSRDTKKPVVLHYHGTSKKIHESNFKLTMKLHKQKISITLPVSNSAKKQIHHLVGNIPMEVLSNGIDSNFFKPSKDQKYRKGDPQFVFVSALRPYKNTLFLVDAMNKILEKFPKSHLNIVGDGVDFIKIKNQISKNDLKNHVELFGNISEQEKLKSIYSSADIFVSASTLEASPVPPLEAMACGIPVVLSDIPPHEELISKSNSGVLFNQNSDDFLEKIIHVYENKDSFGSNARQYAESKDWEFVCKELIKIYEKL